MALHVLEQEQVLPISLEEAWSFFSSPRNLARITPPDMGFVIHEPFDDSPAHAGQRITYTVRPLFGIPLKWVTLIALAEGPHRFVDSQIKGPYKRWWHLHTFEAVEGGVRMRDRVEYELPLGPLGELAHVMFVRKRLQQIFAHRRETLQRLFPGPARTI
ncbi:MAG TPA: SRPBCC family protein [Flavobacteriales bacterium]|nr:SRPBCC family protein [Flavobacteriales bacterium]